MINVKRSYIVIAQTVLIVLLFWGLAFYAKDEYMSFYQQEEAIKTEQLERKGEFVSLSINRQKQIGIETMPLLAYEQNNPLNALATVLSMESLLELRNRYLNAFSNIRVVKASLINSQSSFQRMQTLNMRDKNISDQSLSLAQTNYETDLAKLKASETEINNIKDVMKQGWGETLSAFAIDPSPPTIFQQLLNRHISLILISVPITYTELPPNKIKVTPMGGEPITANFLSNAPNVHQVFSGVTFFYTAKAEHLRNNMRLEVFLEQSKKTQGVLIPKSAVVLHEGSFWVYKKTGNTQFVRIPFEIKQAIKDAWVSEDLRLKPNDEIVSQGAQLLLSEEFKYQITNENEN